jgi:hypothetical protein
LEGSFPKENCGVVLEKEREEMLGMQKKKKKATDVHYPWPHPAYLSPPFN